MCLILMAWQSHPIYPLVIAANRDEFYHRPTEPVHWWEGTEPILAGRDLLSGGTWMGVDEHRRFTAVTNFRDGVPEAAPRTRGALPVDFLRSALRPQQAAEDAVADGAEFGGFNLLVADREEMWWASNSGAGHAERVTPGVHGLSNAALDTPWPKVANGMRAFGAVLAADDGADSSVDAYLDVLADEEPAPWESLPHTGIDRDTERALSSRFIRYGVYGTRAATVLRMRADGAFDLTERRFDLSGPIGDTTIRFDPPS